MMAATKIFVGYKSIKLLGHVVGKGEILMDPEKVEAIQKLLPPTTLKQLRAFLGMTGYYRRFIENFAKKSYFMT